MEGEEYVVYNPGLFEGSFWTHEELQKLCGKLSLPTTGERVELEERLKDWHKERHFDNFEENYPMNVPGNNFTLLPVKIKEIKTSKKRKQMCVIDENEVIPIDPILIRPIQRQRPSNDSYSTPKKGILKKSSNISSEQLFNDSSETNENKTNNTNEPTSETPTEKSSTNKLQFSPFNGVKIISHRYSSWNERRKSSL